MPALASLALVLAPLVGAQDPSSPAAGAPPVAAEGDPRAALPLFDPAPEVSLGIALWEARAGRASAALERLAALRASAQGDFAARLDRETTRLEAWRALRDAWLATLVKSGGKLALSDGDKKVKVGVERLEGGVLHLAPNKPGWKTLAVEDIAAGELAQQMDKEAEALAPPWVRLYAYALAENDKWSKLLKSDGGEGDRLRADAGADFARLLNAGRCAAELQALADLHDPADAGQADALLARIASLRQAGAGLSFVAERREPLRALAARAHAARFDAAGLGAVLKGKVEELGGGRIKVEYAFDSEEELLDFRAGGEYMRDHHKRLPGLKDGLKDGFWIQDGSLRAEGQAALRLIVPFAAPMSVEYELSIDPPKEGDSPVPLLFVGLCDDEAYHFGWSSVSGDVEVWNERGDVRNERSSTGMLVLGRGMTTKLVHDGERLSCLRDKAETAAIACPFVRGTVFLWAHSSLRLNLRRLAVEGVVDDAARAALRERWVEEALAGF